MAAFLASLFGGAKKKTPGLPVTPLPAPRPIAPLAAAPVAPVPPVAPVAPVVVPDKVRDALDRGTRPRKRRKPASTALTTPAMPSTLVGGNY